ncbi:MAG TPA: hypothetical protein VHN12_15415 [Geobacteraceae bacterium]|nr:hypothetical protein [Geobacteraceae bacterium]
MESGEVNRVHHLELSDMPFKNFIVACEKDGFQFFRTCKMQGINTLDAACGFNLLSPVE